jgi:hypothetical protein
MTKQDVKWAGTHDWFIGSEDAGSEGQCVYVRLADTCVEPLECFTSLKELTEWAGY